MNGLECCKNCKFWLNIKDSPNWQNMGWEYRNESLVETTNLSSEYSYCGSLGSRGYCRRETVNGGQTRSKDWCGHYQPKGSIALIYADYLEENGELTAANKLRKFDNEH